MVVGEVEGVAVVVGGYGGSYSGGEPVGFGGFGLLQNMHRGEIGARVISPQGGRREGNGG